MNVITPLIMCLPFIVLVAWLIFFVAWYLLGLPMAPGYPAKL